MKGRMSVTIKTTQEQAEAFRRGDQKAVTNLTLRTELLTLTCQRDARMVDPNGVEVVAVRYTRAR
jgi:hypothetical protein